MKQFHSTHQVAEKEVEEEKQPQIIKKVILPDQTQLNVKLNDNKIILSPQKNNDELKISEPIIMKPLNSPPKLPQKSSYFGESINSILPPTQTLQSLETTIQSQTTTNLKEILNNKLKTTL